MPKRKIQLREEIQQSAPFASSEEEVFLNLQRTAHLLTRSLAAVLKAGGLTAGQYNVLRILRGARPDALTCGEISERLVTPGPDVTRLLDRLVGRGLAERARDEADRRVVRARITPAGLELLADLDGPVSDWLRQRLGHLKKSEQRSLIHLMERGRERVS